MKLSMKRISRVLACAAAAVVLSFALASCGGDSQQKTPAQLNREYMASVNSISTEAADALSSFNEAVSQGDLAAMRLSASDAAKKLEKISALSAPEPLAQVHEEYKAGVDDLTTALSEYVEAYASLQNASGAQSQEQSSQGQNQSVDSSALQAQLQEIQARYDSGIKHLSEADAMVAQLAGDGGSSSSAKGEEGDASSDQQQDAE
ncbi:MAG: hypothetical protein Q4D92_03510 [Slackia sp.]|nr:hypothetical protein [Slackia sp.]